MSVAVANATNQYVFRRNFSTRKWESLAGSGGTCRIQVLKKAGAVDYTLRIYPEEGENREHKLSGENRVHFSDGFIQVPVSDSKELYGIKFKNVIEGEEFYMKMVNALGLPRSYPKTTIGDDGNPNPIGSGGGHQQAPMTITGVPLSHGHVLRASEPPSNKPPQAGGIPVLPYSQQSVKLPPSMQRSKDMPQGQPLPPQQLQRSNTLPPGQRPSLPRSSGIPMSLAQNHFNHTPSVQQQRGYNAPPPQGMMFDRQGEMPHRQFVDHAPPPQPGSTQKYLVGESRPPVQPGQTEIRPPLQPGSTVRVGGKDYFDGSERTGMEHGIDLNGPGMGPGGMGMGHNDPRIGPGRGAGGGVMGMGPDGTRMGVGGPGMGQNRPEVGGSGSRLVGQQSPRTSSKRRPPMSMQASDVRSVAASMVDAMNHGDEDRSKSMFDILLRYMKEPETGGKFELNFDNPKETPPKSSTFTLNIQVEFQQPNKRPIPIFLYNVSAEDSITVLSARVEQEFYIPKLSQNWIIGPRLVKGTELNKPIKEFGVLGDGVTEVNVFMYVMHTKKAQVPNEAAKLRQQQHLRQQQQGLQDIQKAPSNQQPPRPQGGGGGGGGGDPAASYRPQPSREGYRQEEEPVDDTYSHLGNRGYRPPGQDRQPYNVVNDPTYSRLEQFQGGGGGRGGVGNQPQMMNGIHAPPDEMLQQNRAQGGMGQNQRGMIPPHLRHDMLAQYPPGQQGGQRYPPGGQMQQMYPPGPGGQQMYPPGHQLYDEIPARMEVQQLPVVQPMPVVQPPPPPPKRKEPQGWVCPTCTLVNNPRRPGCEVCSTDRPADYVVPEEAPMADFEKKAKENEALFEEAWKKRAEERFKEMVDLENAEVVTNTDEFECQICYLDVEKGEGIVLRNCLHQFCRECIKNSVMMSNEAEVKCPFNDKYECNAVISEREIKACVTEEELQAYHKRVLSQAENALANSFHCKTPDCRGWCIYEDEVNEFTCPVCEKKNCILCKAIHEGMNCKEYQDDLKRLAENDAAAKATQDMLENLVKNGEAMHCPTCKVVVQKKEGCDWIRCSMCKTEICWATKGPRWGPKGRGDITGGCRCRVNGKKCHALCRNCH